MFSLVSRIAHGVELAQGFEVRGFLLEREHPDNRRPSNGAYVDLVSGIYSALSDAPGRLVNVPGNFMGVLGILVCALLKRGLSIYK